MGEVSTSAIKDGGAIVIARMWKGAPWVPGKDERVSLDSPWEIEAYGREVGLYHRWKNLRKVVDAVY